MRKLVKDGVEWIKTYPTGDAAAPDTADHHTLCMTFEEMAAVVAEAHNYRRKVTGHCRATQGIKNALRAGFDCLEHGTFMDSEALDMLLERNTPVVPAFNSNTRASKKARASACRSRWSTVTRKRSRGARKRPDDLESRRPAGNGRRLRLCLEPAR